MNLAETVDSNATAFALTREAVAQHEGGKIDSKFAIGDALLVEIGIPGTRAAETQARLKKCSEYLLDLGYQYEPKTLDAIRRIAHAYPKDERGDLLHSMRRPTWAALEVAARDPSILDDMITVMDGGKPSLRLPDMVIISLRKRKLIRVQDLRDTFKHLDAVEKRAYDTTMPNPPIEEIDLTNGEDEDDELERDPGEILLNIETPEDRKFRGDTSMLGKKGRDATARKSYSLAEARGLREEDNAPIAAAMSDKGEFVEVYGHETEGFTYVVHTDENLDETQRRLATIDHLVTLIRLSETNLHGFIQAYHESGLTVDDAVDLFEALDGVRAAWELAHEMINGYMPEMH